MHYGTVIKEGNELIDKLLNREECGKIETKDDPEFPFSQKTFELLSGLRNYPTKDFYYSEKDYFKSFLETPFQEVFKDVAEKLPIELKNYLEVEKKLFSRILKLIKN